MRLKPFQSHEAGSGLAIQLVLPRGACRRWHLAIAVNLAAAGHGVSVTRVATTAREPAALALLRLTEQTLFSSRAIGAADFGAPVADGAFDPYCTGGHPNLTIDLSGREAPPASRIPVLQPLFNRSPDDLALFDGLLGNRPASIEWRRIDDGAILADGVAAVTAPHILTQGFSEALSLAVVLVDRAVLAARNAPGDRSTASIRSMARPASSARLTGFALGSLAERLLARLTTAVTTSRQWNIAWRTDHPGRGIVETATLDLAGFRWLERDSARYFADPFPVAYQGHTYLFCEEYPYARGKGHLSFMEIFSDGTHGAIRPMLEADHHLSYPCIFSHGGQIWMIPETAEAGTLDLYRAERFPDRWVRHKTLLDNCYFADATFFEHAGRCWIAATAPAFGQSDRDSLSLFMSDRPDGDWMAHPMNPVVADVAGSRPAGWIERCADGLRRPAQDCTGGYGWGLTIARIDRLTPYDYAETRLVRIHPPAAIDAVGLHSVNRGGGIEVIDAIVP